MGWMDEIGEEKGGVERDSGGSSITDITCYTRTGGFKFPKSREVPLINFIPYKPRING